MQETIRAAGLLEEDGGAGGGLLLLVSSPVLRPGRTLELRPGADCIIGREGVEALPLDEDETVSRRHARIQVDEAGASLADLGSANGTWCNRNRVTGSVRLQDRDRIQIGRQLFVWLCGSGLEERFHAALRELAERDPLTGLVNRRRFQEALEEEVRRCVRYGRDVAVVLFDLDGLKPVNDGLGHAAGDTLLRAIAEVIQSIARHEHLPARLGGDEFAVLCPECDLSGGLAVAERMRAAIAKTPVDWNGQELRVTASCGVAALKAGMPRAANGGADATPTGSVAGDLMRDADAASYAAKRSGRNRVCAEGGSAPVAQPDDEQGEPHHTQDEGDADRGRV